MYNPSWKTGGTIDTRPLPTSFYHATSLDAAIKIQQTGFRPSTKGMLGAGVYITNHVRKTEKYMERNSCVHGGVVLKLEVDLGNCLRVVSAKMSHGAHAWTRTHDSVWWDRGNNKGENCVKDPKRIKIVDAYLGKAAEAQKAGYFVEAGKVVKKAPKTGWVMAGDELAPTEFYHGTSLEGALAIQDDGFRVDLAGSNDSTMLGQGVYITTSLLKAYAYADNVHKKGKRRPHGGAVLKLKVDLGKCYRCKGGKKMKKDGKGPDDLPMRKDWMNRGYDSCWSPAGYGGVRGEHCVRDPKRIEVVDVYLMDTVKAGDAGYRVVPKDGSAWEWET